MRFEYVPAKPWFYKPVGTWKSIENSPLKPLMNFVDDLWLRDAYKVAHDLHQQVQFDLAHQLTWVGFRFPGYLWRLDLPFVWGPIGGLENTPWHLLPLFGPQGAVYYACRNFINSFHKRFLPTPKQAMRKARGSIIAATNGIQREIRKCYSETSEVICEVGPPELSQKPVCERGVGEPFRICWSGLHVPGKALPLLLRALAALPKTIDWRLSILGEGPCTRRWRKLAETLRLGANCQWHGWLGREAAVSRIESAHAFVITSLKDLTSTVLLEALSRGVPVVALDHCGFSHVLSAACGIAVPVGTERTIVTGIADALATLANDEPLRKRMAEAAIKRASEYSWESKALALDKIYRRAVSRAVLPWP